MNRYEKEIKAIDEAMLNHANEIDTLYERERKDDRKLTDEERLEVEEHVKAIDTLKLEKAENEKNVKTLEDVKDISRKLGPAISVGMEPADRIAEAANRYFNGASKSIGEQFINSAGYKAAVNAYRETGRVPSNFSTGPVALETKGTLLEGSSSPGSGTGGGLIPIPQVVPGVTETLFQRLTVADLLLSGQAAGNTIRYVVEGTATSGAAGVAEGGTKPESTLALSTKDEPIKKIATLLPVSEEMLEDAPAIQSYINGRLTLFVQHEEERQLLRGTASGNEVQGILTSRSVPIYAGGTTAGDKATQLFKAMNGMRGSAFLEPEWLIIHPSDWEDLRLKQDLNNQFYGGGPFLPQYGGQGFVGANNQVSGPTDSLWQKPVYVTAAIGGAGTALIGTRAAAQVWRRGGLSVEASNSHSNYFQLNLVALRAEERLGLAVYRPGGFVEARIA